MRSFDLDCISILIRDILTLNKIKHFETTSELRTTQELQDFKSSSSSIYSALRFYDSEYDSFRKDNELHTL